MKIIIVLTIAFPTLVLGATEEVGRCANHFRVNPEDIKLANFGKDICRVYCVHNNTISYVDAADGTECERNIPAAQRTRACKHGECVINQEPERPGKLSIQVVRGDLPEIDGKSPSARVRLTMTTNGCQSCPSRCSCNYDYQYTKYIEKNKLPKWDHTFNTLHPFAKFDGDISFSLTVLDNSTGHEASIGSTSWFQLKEIEKGKHNGLEWPFTFSVNGRSGVIWAVFNWNGHSN